MHIINVLYHDMTEKSNFFPWFW